MYSHDSWGLGHLRRSLAIAGALSDCCEDAEILLVTGSPCATQFDLPEHCDVLKLPAVSKNAEGDYIPRNLPGAVATTIALRSRLITEAFHAYDPHLVIIDHQLTGLLGEALNMLREAHILGKTLIYGMRDVLDSPQAVDRAWHDADHRWALEEAFDKICVYGDPMVFDPRQRYQLLKPLKHKIEFSGYVSPAVEVNRRQPIPALRKQVLVTMGGGEDSAHRVETYLEALKLAPTNWDSHIVLGPLMADSHVRYFKRRVYSLGLSAQVRLSRFHRNIARLLQSSDAAVCMAGYNTCAEIMHNRVPAILLPRTNPRKEQRIRARRLQEMGIAQCLEHPEPASLREHLERALQAGLPRPVYPRLDGLAGVCRIIQQTMEEKHAALHLRSRAQCQAAAD